VSSDGQYIFGQSGNVAGQFQYDLVRPDGSVANTLNVSAVIGSASFSDNFKFLFAITRHNFSASDTNGNFDIYRLSVPAFHADLGSSSRNGMTPASSPGDFYKTSPDGRFLIYRSAAT